MSDPVASVEFTLPSDSGSYANSNTRQVIPPGIIPPGAKYRIGIRAHGTQGSNFPVIKMGHGVPGTFNFEAAPALVKFNQLIPLQAGMVIQASEMVWSDLIEFTYDDAKPALFHLRSLADGVRYGANGVPSGFQDIPAGVKWGFKYGDDESALLEVSGYTPSSDGAIMGIAAIELYDEGEPTDNLFWQEVGRILTFKFSAARRLAFYDATIDNISIPAGFTEGQWCTIDLNNGAHWQGQDPLLPDVDDIVSVRVHVSLTLTHAGSGLAEVLLTTRGPKIDPHPQVGYQGHAIASVAAQGARQQIEIDIPVIDGKFEAFWARRQGVQGLGLEGIAGGVTAFISEVRYRAT